MDWDPISFLSDFQTIILPEFRKLERLGATSSTLATLQSMAAAHLESPAFYHNIHFGINWLALCNSFGLVLLGICRCVSIVQDRRKRSQERKLASAVRSALLVNGNNYPRDINDSCPQYLGMPICQGSILHEVHSSCTINCIRRPMLPNRVLRSEDEDRKLDHDNISKLP